MKRLVLVAFLIGVPFLAAAGQERITLTTPESTPNNTQYRLRLFTQDLESAEIRIELLGQRGERVSCLYSGSTTPKGSTLLPLLNKADFSKPYAGNATTGSGIQHIFHRLVIMGESATVCDKTIVGTLTGSVP